jgi:hypothetical protein
VFENRLLRTPESKKQQYDGEYFKVGDITIDSFDKVFLWKTIQGTGNR